ncbi:MAG: terpene cyclase/mutase family protein [Planctomycetes bacterium]|nr:terpene cyclase/mutase family protein [Planctomycetota bacterium]
MPANQQQPQQQYEQPADQEYYGQQEQAAQGGKPGEDLSALASVPWLAIALAAHVIFLVIAWFIVAVPPETKKIDITQAAVDTTPVPPEPEMKPPEQVEHPKDEPPREDPTEDPRIVEDATDDNNEDPSDQPNKDLAPNPNKDDSNAESPNPNRGPSSAVGLGGGAGGGGGRGGAGGFAYRRARGGGGRPHDNRVRAALEWLRDHQNFDGFWSGARFSEDTTRKNARKTYNLEFVNAGKPEGDKGWDASADIGLTGLSLLAFVGAGFDHKEGDYKETCRKAIMYLRKVQTNDGCFGPKDEDSFVYSHALSAMALAEAYGLSGDAALKGTAERAVEFMLNAQNPDLGWRYGVKYGENDTSVTGWMVLALKSCKIAGLEFDSHKVYQGAAKWLDQATIPVGGYPKTGYNSPGTDNARLRSSQDYLTNPSMDAINVMTRLFMGPDGWDLNNSTLKAQAKNMIDPAFLPAWEHHKIDYYYWYYASLALYQVGADTWKKWESAMSKTLLDNQRGFRPEDKGTTKDTLDEHGSWDAVDAWHAAGGRVYSTAINCLTLQVYYRYKKAHKS